MNKWTLQWLDPISGGNLNLCQNVLKNKAGIYIWSHKPTNQVVYIGQAQDFYSRVYEDEVEKFLKKGKWNLYDLEKEPDFGELLKKYSLQYSMEGANETKMLFIPNQNNSDDLWVNYWQPKVNGYLQKLCFYFCTGQWSSDKNNREALEATLLWEYKRDYAQRIGLPKSEKDNKRISIGKIQGSNLSGIVKFTHKGNTKSLPKEIQKILC